MPKQKQLLKIGKQRGKQASKGPETADDFLAVGVELEEAGEKWRAGDAVKSTRFFLRAIETYDGGLQRFPQSFDLVYNKARLQYDLSQQPRLLPHLPSSLLELLQLSLDSHRRGLTLKQDDADTFFNCAQVLTSLGEVLSEGSASLRVNKAEALKAFQEALELFQRCLSVQEFQYSQTQEQEQEADISASNIAQAQDELSRTDSPASRASEDEQWASIIRPTTKSTLLDTTIAQIETMTSLCSLLVTEDPNGLAWIEEYSNEILKKAADLMVGSEKGFEVTMARANFISAYTDASFRAGRIDLPTYQRELDAAFNNDLDFSKSPQGLCDRADALISFNTSIYTAFNVNGLAATDLAQLNDIRWKRLTKAINDLTAATKLPDAQNLPKIHLRRGDCELLRHRLGEEPTAYQLARKNAAMLLKNAETYYNGARRAAEAEQSIDEALEASVKEAVLLKVHGQGEELSKLAKSNRTKVLSIMEDMREEFLMSDHDLMIASS